VIAKIAIANAASGVVPQTTKMIDNDSVSLIKTGLLSSSVV